MTEITLVTASGKTIELKVDSWVEECGIILYQGRYFNYDARTNKYFESDVFVVEANQ